MSLRSVAALMPSSATWSMTSARDIIGRTSTRPSVVTTTPTPQTTVIETRGGGSGVGIFIGFVLLLAVAIGAFYLISQNNSKNSKDAAISSAAKSVESVHSILPRQILICVFEENVQNIVWNRRCMG